jgi:tetratricopeptide (TPR) repeat protein
MKRKQLAVAIATIILAGVIWILYAVDPNRFSFLQKEDATLDSSGYSGTQSCRECHENFYQLWAPSNHGLAMQPFTPELFQTKLTAHKEDLAIGNFQYRVEFDGNEAWVKESGQGGDKLFPMIHAMGGKNVYYFLTSMDRGRLQVLPLAYDVQREGWFDTAASGIRHFQDVEEEPVDWRDQEYTFNTSCYMCHVSQLTRNYSLDTDSYNTVWREPGINCEACHGSAAEHVRVCEEAGEGQIPEDLKIDVISPPAFSRQLAADACAPCHAKASALTASFPPGERFFDHFDLGLFELPDYYPDGRDLGENYTFTQWLMSPCAKSGQMDCLHCHTSSGRYRFAEEGKNNACMPCHAERVKNASEHSRHPEESEGNLCISCHMPMTEFARMRRSDHSMLPPTPSTSMKYGSPNACNICHEDKDAEWADGWVRQWRKRDYQAAVLHRASLIDAARKQDWSRLPAVLDYLKSDDHDSVFAASLIRLLRNCEDERKWPVLMAAMDDPSSLVRASAAESLGDRLDDQILPFLIKAAKDDTRLVRIRAAVALAPVSHSMPDDSAASAVNSAVAEFTASIDARPDYWASHYNMGNFQMARREFQKAVASFETATRLNPDVTMPYVNASFAYNALGQNDKAEQRLIRAHEMEPESFEVNLNLGLLLGEQKRIEEALQYLRAAAKLDPKSAVVAYNLGIMNAELGNMSEAIARLRDAYEFQPSEPRYGYSLAFYLLQSENIRGATGILEGMVSEKTSYIDVYLLLGEIYQKQGRQNDTVRLLGHALSNVDLSAAERKALEDRIASLSK